jgi:hypothetical protein
MLALAQIEPWHFAVCYAPGVPQQAPFRGFWHDPVQHNTVGVMLGVDLLPSADGWCFLESNLRAALRAQRSALYHRDPFITNLLNFVRAKGYQNLIVMTHAHLDKQMVKQFEDGAAAHKIRLTIVPDPNLHKTADGQSYGVPPLHAGGTLVVRVKMYPTSLDFLFHHKLASRRALGLYERRTAEPTLLLPPTGLQPSLDKINPDEPFPNLVYKLPEGGQGKEVVFLKATSLEHAHALIYEAHRLLRPPDRPLTRLIKQMLKRPESPDGVFQPYVRSTMLPGRRLYIVRAHVLLTPIGTHFLSAHRVVSDIPVPEHLSAGLVQSQTPYLVNYSSGSRYEIVPPEEEATVVAAALAVADGLSWAATSSFSTEA